MTFVSIVIPAFNAEEYLNRCLVHIRLQTHKNFECILIDDGSSDNTGRICDEVAKQDSRFRVVHQDNIGISAARNKGLDLATGEHVCFCDSDDWYHPQYLEILCDALNNHPKATFALAHRKIVYSYEDYNTIGFPQIKILTHSDIYRQMFTDFQYASANCKLIRRSAIKGIRFRDTATEDIDFNMRLFQQAKEFVTVPHVLYFYMQRQGSILHPKDLVSRCIAELNGWRDLYHNYFKGESELHQSFFLLRVYKLVVTRFNLVSHDIEVNKGIKLLLEDTLKAFKNNKHISKTMKLLCLACIRHPQLYSAGKSAYGLYYRLTH